MLLPRNTWRVFGRVHFGAAAQLSLNWEPIKRKLVGLFPKMNPRWFLADTEGCFCRLFGSYRVLLRSFKATCFTFFNGASPPTKRKSSEFRLRHPAAPLSGKTISRPQPTGGPQKAVFAGIGSGYEAGWSLNQAAETLVSYIIRFFKAEHINQLCRSGKEMSFQLFFFYV